MRTNTRKSIWNAILALALCIAACLGVACKKEETSSSSAPTSSEETVYVLNQPVLELFVGETFSLSVLNAGAGDSVEWRSTQAGVASVDGSGTVTANAPGTASVHATLGDKTLTCIVTVNVTLNVLPTVEFKGMQPRDGEYKLYLMQGDEYEVTPALYVGGEETETAFTLTSDNAAVTVEGNTLTANAAVQSAKITASCTYENQTYSVVCYVSVEEVA